MEIFDPVLESEERCEGVGTGCTLALAFPFLVAGPEPDFKVLIAGANDELVCIGVGVTLREPDCSERMEAFTHSTSGRCDFSAENS
jgi:predicted HAD superfamily phosphohydrolase